MKNIPLTQGKFAIVDDEDYDWLNQWKWSLHNGYSTPYARRQSGGVGILMHRYILKAPDTKQVNHINFNGLDNRRCNLESVSQRSNLSHRRKRGTSEYTGVSWYKQLGMWRSQIYANGRNIGIGYFYSEYNAALAYQICLRYSAAL